VQHLVPILLEDVIDDAGAVAGPAELVAYFPRESVIGWGVGGDMKGRADVRSVEVVCQQTAIDEQILLVGAVLFVVQVGSKEVLHSKAAKIFNFSRGIFGMRSTTDPVAVLHSNCAPERPLPNLHLGVLLALKRCNQLDLLYLQQVVLVYIFGLQLHLGGCDITLRVCVLLPLREGPSEPILALVLPHLVQDVPGYDVEGREHFRGLPDKAVKVKVDNAIGYDPALQVEDILSCQGVLCFHEFVVLVELPGEVGGIDPTIAVAGDEERVLDELRPISKELGDKGDGV
jgi:hypothetical protein